MLLLVISGSSPDPVARSQETGIRLSSYWAHIRIPGQVRGHHSWLPKLAFMPSAGRHEFEKWWQGRAVNFELPVFPCELPRKCHDRAHQHILHPGRPVSDPPPPARLDGLRGHVRSGGGNRSGPPLRRQLRFLGRAVLPAQAAMPNASRAIEASKRNQPSSSSRSMRLPTRPRHFSRAAPSSIPD